MNLTVYQTVYTVLFVLAGVFFVMSIVFFFLFDIRTVMSSLYGRRANTTRSIKSRKTNGNNTGEGPEQVERTIKQKTSAGTILMDGQATVMTRFLETMMIDTDEVESLSDVSTEPLDDRVRAVAMTNESVKRKLDFQPDIKILEYSAGDRI